MAAQDEATEVIIEILTQINDLSGAALEALLQGQGGGEGGPPPEGGAPPEGAAPPEGPPPGA